MTDARNGYVESLAEIQHRMAEGGIKSRPATYKGITFRSKLEARFATHLDDIGERWSYEPEPFGTSGHGYLPDFEILGGPRRTFIELKPTIQEALTARRKVQVIWDTLPDALIIIASAEGCRFYGALRGTTWTTWQERWA